ncbi:tubulin polyglutamylase TTLL4-like isoform X1 [Pecten maximus]|uniref:tubulin polyglutamylase TTLL4-like isoform X1 n=1 Tax=Pecten maximus TaxID=6579 RepID=UPI00145916E0|nr:tubulin polyglutamylase TTLL4-like isoform X1 [Pecten maximus]
MGQRSSKVRNKKSGGALFTKKRDPSFLHSTDKVVIEETIIELDGEKSIEADDKNVDRSGLFCVDNPTKDGNKTPFNVEIEELDTEAAIEVVRLTNDVERSSNEEVKSAEPKVQVGGKRPRESGPVNPGNNVVEDEGSVGGKGLKTDEDNNVANLKENNCEDEDSKFTGVVKRRFTLEEDDVDDSGVQWVPFNKSQGHTEVSCKETEKKHVHFSEVIEEKLLEKVSDEEESDCSGEDENDSSDSSVGEVEEEENDEDSESDNESEGSDESTNESSNEEDDDGKDGNQYALENVGRTSKSPVGKLQVTSGKKSKSPPATRNNSVNSARSGDNKIPSDDLETFMYLQPCDKVVVVEKDMKSFPVRNDKIYITCIKPAVVNEASPKPESLTKLHKNGYSPVQSPHMGNNGYSLVKSPRSLTTGCSPTRSPVSVANGYSLTGNLPSVIKGPSQGSGTVSKKSVLNGSSPTFSTCELKANDKDLREIDNKIRNDNFLEPGDSAAYLKVKLGGDEKKECDEQSRRGTPGLYVKETIYKLDEKGQRGHKQRVPVRVRFQNPGTDYRKKPELCLLKLDSFVSSPRTVTKKVGNILRAKENKRERLPGDGEASLEEFGDDDDDGIDCLEDDYVGGSDGESDGYSITSSISRQSSAARSRARSARRSAARSASSTSEDSRPRTAKASASAITTTEQEKVPQSPLRPSLFPNIPPTINFVVEGEKVEQLPWEYRKLLKWRMSPITPNIVKHTLARVGFRITKRNHDWLGCWGKHMKSQGFKAIREYQKLNHFPGSFQIGRKDRLWRNLSKMQLHCGKKEFGFFPQTFVLPYDNKLLKRAWEDGGNKQKWIIKPPASARGIGIKVISKWNQIPRKRAVIVQRYLGRPYLINDSKFDMRIYVYVSSYDPLRVYVFEDGLARFASCKYSSSMKNLNNKFMHLTNYSINKKNDDYQANGDEKLCQGHKWGLKALWNYMKRQGVNTAAIWENIKDLVIKTIVCADSPINSMIKANVRSRYCIHELFGFDILLDENLKPWILEVNISPSLHSNSQLDINIKGQMIRDLFNIAGFRIPEKHDVVVHSNQTTTTDFSNHVPSNDYCMDKRLFAQNHSSDERSKHAYYSQRHQDEQVLQTILDVLTPDDIRILTESIDEDSRKGSFQRVFPTPSTHKYMHFFETQRYYNLLLDQYVQRYNRMEQKGISLLELYCDEGVHLANPTDNPYHQWAPPNSGLNSFRGEPRMQSAPQPKHDIRAAMHVRSSVSTSQLPKVSKKPPRAPAVAIHSHRTASQSSSASSMTSPGETTPITNYASVASLSATKSR